MSLTDQERTKYTKMWDLPAYRKVAPGERQVSKAIESLSMKPGSTLLDFGVGTGRAAQSFQDKGFIVTGVDIAENCLDPAVSVPVIIASLWSLPEDLTADYGFCTDVMEHIPTEKVDDVLRCISKAVPKCFFMIDTVPDRMGKLIGEKLHVTVQREPWWTEQIEKYFKVMDSEANSHSVQFVVETL